MTDIEITTQDEDASINLDAVLLGADSQASDVPSVFGLDTIWTYLKTLSNTWSGNQTFTASVVIENLPTSDPSVAGQLWNNSGVINVSSG